MKQKKSLLGMTLSEITQCVKELNFPKYAAKQILDWV